MTVRIAHISDSHFDERARLADVCDVHNAFVEQVSEADVDLIVHSGDWFERASTPRERLEVVDFLCYAAEFAPVFGVKGNHDVELDLSIFERLQSAHDICILDRPTVGLEAPIYYSAKEAPTQILCLGVPWFDRAHIAGELGPNVDVEDTRTATIQAARELLQSVGTVARRHRGKPSVLVAHVMVAGSEVSSGQTLIGSTVELSPADLLEVGASYAALGHVHKPQAWFEGRVAYAGSPHRCNFGEDEAKGWRLVTLDDNGDFVSSRFVELPARRRIKVELDFSDPDADASFALDDLERALEAGEKDVDGALVRVRYRVRPDAVHRVNEVALVELLGRMGAVHVKLEAVVETKARARVPEIASAETTFDKLEAYLEAKAIEVPEERRGRLRAKLALLEG